MQPNKTITTKRFTHGREYILLAAFASTLLAGCRGHASAEGTFDKTFAVDGPVRLVLSTGSGDSRVTTGPPGQVRVHGEIQANSWSEESGKRHVQEAESNPPVSQESNLIRVGGGSQHGGSVSIDYTIVLPADSEIHITTGSGDVEVTGVKGPANFATGSGAISASNIAGDVHATAGSGDIKLSNIQGEVQAAVGSGDLTLEDVHGLARLHTGSGDLGITNPGDAVEINTVSGNINIKGASPDIRVRTSSGDVNVEGNPGASNYWDFNTSSGEVVLQVPPTASFRLYARSSSGDIDAAIPIVMEGTAGKHELRARIGDGKARVEVETSSGDISLK
jgi:DUF4097 and DUF4098 domain-containing protein YvlB